MVGSILGKAQQIIKNFKNDKVAMLQVILISDSIFP
jgi:hypothetical protein